MGTRLWPSKWIRKENFLLTLVCGKIKVRWVLIKDSKVWHFTSQSNSCESGQLQFNFLASHYSGQGRFFIVFRLVYPISLFLIGWIEKNSQRQSLWWCHLLQRWRQTRWWFKSNEPTTNRWTRVGSINRVYRGYELSRTTNTLQSKTRWWNISSTWWRQSRLQWSKWSQRSTIATIHCWWLQSI